MIQEQIALHGIEMQSLPTAIDGPPTPGKTGFPRS
jgi:hypothetical protein